MTPRLARRAGAAALAVALAASPALAWESQTTHAGLAEQAALASHLHARLRGLGFTRGLYEPLTMPPADAPELIAALRRLDPAGGFVPDNRGRQYALSWLAAGAALADAPFAANHFFDPTTGKGWQRPGVGLVDSVEESVVERLGRASIPDRGVPAPDWVVAKDNPLGLDGFLDQYAKAVRASTPGERSRHMAGALVAAGAILHVLADMGSPSHVRGDTAAHFDPVGRGRDDLGSRFERIAALAWGRLGVPAPSRVVTRPTLRAFFTGPGTGTGAEVGLADATAGRWFSPHTLPRPMRITAAVGRTQVTPQLVRPKPAPPARLNLMAASQEQGATLDDADGTCLSRYRVAHGLLTWWLDDDCLLEQAAAILPEVASFEAGLLEFLFRGELNVQVNGGDVAVSAATPLGAGDVEILAEDSRGVRTPVATVKSQAATTGAALARAAAPAGAVRLIALFRGADAAGEPVIAVGAADRK